MLLLFGFCRKFGFKGEKVGAIGVGGREIEVGCVIVSFRSLRFYGIFGFICWKVFVVVMFVILVVFFF